MIREAIFHISRDNMCYALNEDELIISIKTGKDIKSVEIEWGDPFAAGIMGGAERWSGKREEMPQPLELENHLWWSIRVKPPYKRCVYYFVLTDGCETLCLLEDGFYTESELAATSRRLQYFMMPWMNSSDIISAPEWVRHAVWYQIFPERFARAGEKQPGHKPWKSEKIERPKDFRQQLRYGGNLKGITSRLEYLSELGITALYLNPIFKSPTDHKYNIDDYYEIDPEFGTKEDFRELCEKARSLGIKIMLDMVFNHSGFSFAPFVDVMKNGESSRYKDWFMINRFPVTLDDSTRDGRFYSFAFAQYMPKLNTNNPEVISYCAEVCEYWVREFGVDALRFDVANEVSHKFLKVIRERVKAINPDIYLLAEIWHDSTQWLHGDEFDAIMNYPLTETISGFWKDTSQSSRELEQGINRCLVMYPRQCSEVMFNLLDSHDTERLYYRCNHNEDWFFQQLVMLFTLYGSPCIYYGTEIMLDGAHDPDCRRCMPWEELDRGEYDEIISQVKRLIRLKREIPELSSMDVKFSNSDDSRRVKYLRGENILVEINAGDDKMELEAGEVLFSRGVEDGAVLPGGCAVVALALAQAQ